MSQELVEARHLVELGYLEEIFIAMGYENVQLLEKSAELPFHTLLVGLESDAQGRPIEMALTFYPVVEFENTLFLQYYITLPFSLDQKAIERLYPFLPYLNQRMVVGHFGVAEDESRLHLRYVQALNASDLITRERVEDVIILLSFAPVLFGPTLEQLALGQITFAQACAQIKQAYSVS